MLIGFEDAAKESGRRGRALRVMRLVVPFLSWRWLSDPSTVSEDERVPGPDDPIMPAGRTLAAGTVMRRRRLRHVLTTWGGGGLLVLGIFGYTIGDYALSGGEDYPFSIDGTALAVGFALALLIGLALPAARKLRPARRSDHLGLAPGRRELRRGRSIAFELSLSEVARRTDRVEVGLTCRRQWTRGEPVRGLWIIRDECLWESWQPVVLTQGSSQQLELAVPRGGKSSRENEDGSVYWLLSARIRGRRHRSDVPVWILPS